MLVEGQTVGSIEGFRLDLDEGLDRDLARTLMAAARKALAREFPARLKRLEAETDDTAFTLLDGEISWRGQRLARLRPGDWELAPRVEPLDSEFLSGPDRERLRRRLAAMKCVSLLRETLWSIVSEIHSTLDFDYEDYTAKNLARLENALDTFRQMR